MVKPYQHLGYAQRCQIHALKARGDSHRAIAKHLAVAPSTIDREIKRNTGFRGYRYKQAQQKCEARRHQKRPAQVKLTPQLEALAREKLTRCQWSPQQIAGWLAKEHTLTISHEALYQWIWADKKAGGPLYLNLRRRAKTYQKRVNGKTSRGRIVGRVDIDQRPAIVETRSRVGDWEADTIVGLGHVSALVTLVERKTRYTRIVRVLANTAVLVKEAIIGALEPFKSVVETITFDNEKEFSQHGQIAETLEASTYFAKPYHSWERGLNENTNGLIRQYFPKKTDFREVSDEEVARVEGLLNERPRKCLGYDTPARVMRQAA